MGSLDSLIGGLMNVVGEVIVDAMRDYRNGNVKEARTKIERFTALGRATLRGDRAEAEKVLRDRFAGEATPVNIYEEVGDSITSD